LVANSFAGVVYLIDASTDSFTTSSFSASTPTLMTVSPGKEVALIFATGGNSVSVINNSTEQLAGMIVLPDVTESMVAKSSSLGYAAIRNALVPGAPEVGQVVALDLTNSAISATIAVPRARHGVACTVGKSAITVIDVASNVATPVCGFDQAAWGVFANDTTAYIENCGQECGGTQASVQKLDLSAVIPTPVTTTVNPALPPAVNVPKSGATVQNGATIAVLNGNTLYVAGTEIDTTSRVSTGRLNAFDVSSGTPTPVGAVNNAQISDGSHTRMVLASSNKLFIGSTGCTNVGTAGCLTIFDTGANTAVIQPARGFVTGMTPIPNRNIVYVTEGGDLDIYDTTTNALSTGKSINIVGFASDAVSIDK
jgi:hypothetical protein